MKIEILRSEWFKIALIVLGLLVIWTWQRSLDIEDTYHAVECNLNQNSNSTMCENWYGAAYNRAFPVS